MKRILLTGNSAVAWGARLADVDYIPAFPITPQTGINVSRGLASPITLEPDHNDVLAARDSGFLQIHCSTCQEVLDSTLMAYRLAEDERVRLPVIVNMDGFYLSFTREPVEIPDAGAASRMRPRCL